MKCLWLIESKGFGFRCHAFPDRIPEMIILSVATHREPFPGDNGIQFVERDESLTPEEIEARAAKIKGDFSAAERQRFLKEAQE